MADLRPKINVTPEVGVARNAYQNAFSDFINSLDKPFDTIGSYISNFEKQKFEKEKTAEEQRRWDIANARAEADAKRKEDTYNREVAEKTATNEALMAVLDPTGFKAGKMSAEQAAIQNSLNALNPEDRLLAEKQLKAYSPEQSSSQWLANALGNVNADQSKIVSTKKNVYDIAASTPGTPEYEAKVAADRAEKRWASDLAFSRQKEAALFSDNLARKREEDKELKENELANKLSNLLDVSTTKEVGKEVDVPGTPKEAKAKIEADQAAYGVLYNNYFKKNPNATFEEADNAIRRQLNITVPIDKYFAREDSTKTVVEKELKSKNEYISDLLNVAKEQGIVNPKTLQLIQEQAKTAYDVDKEKVKEARAVESLKKAIESEDKKVDTAGIFDSDVLKLKYKDILDRKSDYNKNDSKYVIGSETLKALDEVGIDTWGKGTQKEVVELAKKYKITDKELAAIILTSDLEWSPTMSSTVVKRIEDALETYSKKYKQ